MIKLKPLITEAKQIKLHFRHVLKGGIDASVDVQFSVNDYDNRIIMLPKTSKELDKITALNLYREDIGVLIENRINEQLKPIEVKYDKSYQGAGYGFVVDLEKIVNKLK